MYCENCGGQIRDGADYCGSCGKQVRDGEAPKTGSGHELTRINAAKNRKNPKAAAVLGYFFGSLGYIYLGQWNWFFLGLVIWFVAIPMTLLSSLFVFPIVFAIHQYDMAKDINNLLAEQQERGGATNGEAPANDPLGRPGA